MKDLLKYCLSCPSEFGGEVEAPKSKSVLHRQIICAALADGISVISGYVPCADTEATLSVISSLGGRYTVDGTTLTVYPCNAPKEAILDCGESGSTARFIAPVAASLGCDFTLNGEGRLPERPMDEYIKLFGEHGLKVDSNPGSRSFFKCSGKLKSCSFSLSGSVSSQYITGMLLCSPVISDRVEIHITGKLNSADYVEITLDVMKSFGVECEFNKYDNTIIVSGKYKCGNYVAEGDWSGAAFPLCAGAIHGDVTVKGLNLLSKQGDKRIIDILKAFGANVICSQNSVRVARNCLHGISVDAEDIPDLVPVICAVAAFADGTTEIAGVERLRYKESDRISTVCLALSAIGADIQYDDVSKKLIIHGKKNLAGGCVDSFGDHRIAMTCAICAPGCTQKVEIVNPLCVNKSYSAFYKDYKKLGGIYDVIDMG